MEITAVRTREPLAGGSTVLSELLAEGGSGHHFFGSSVDRVTLCL